MIHTYLKPSKHRGSTTIYSKVGSGLPSMLGRWAIIQIEETVRWGGSPFPRRSGVSLCPPTIFTDEEAMRWGGQSLSTA